MDIVFFVSTPESGHHLASLAKACVRRGVRFACFFTNDGVKALASDDVQHVLTDAEEAVACEHSWAQFRPNETCPVTLGSQTQNSALVARARRVVSL